MPAHAAEAATRLPAPPDLTLPTPRRGYGGLAASLLVHALVILFAIRSGERLWSRTLVPGDPALPALGGGGGGGGPRVTYITLPPASERVMPRMPVAPPAVPPPRPEPKPVPTPRPPASPA
ncbi:MAG TPA: hypothetical protein VHR43_03450, partial [Gemmatimonadales bacterium]|nr:hypothetical protein [Gemmatimonadales bacterium]